MKILFLGDIVGRPARDYLKQFLPSLVEKEAIDWVIANAENAAGGSGLTEKVARELFSSGIDILTTGDHAFKKREIFQILDTMDIVRPLNYGQLAKGRGLIIKEKKGKKICAINLLGRVFMQPVDCPFKAVASVLEDVLKETRVVLVDIHAEATSEKLALGYFLAQKVSAVIGTHTHIPTADERMIENFTAYITDVGMTGSFDSILGRRKEDIIERFLTNIPSRFNLAEADVRIQGVFLEIDESTGRSLNIQRVEYKQEA
ncbi:MAG: TIGR00282 family metallophosphoesterase [Candidatus Omnitrophica bacterium]|nr:TIGR00282 family metallophosphoesterase [Candidatus Omnitrophota bacterium]